MEACPMSTTGLKLWPVCVRLFDELPPLRWFRLAVAGWHFQVDAISLLHDHIWDGTSLILRKGIRRYAHDGQRVLDLGTGHLGLLAIFCARTHDVMMVAVDVNEDFIKNARIVAEASSALKIDFRQSDWFSNVDSTFDLVFGNIPYIPTEVGSSHLHAHTYPELWDGGGDGLMHERTILTNIEHFLRPDGLLLLGIDTSYIPRIATLSLLADQPQLELREVVSSWMGSSEMYVIARKSPAETVH
jgi:methylase of polypeptide subunit release factors